MGRNCKATDWELIERVAVEAIWRAGALIRERLGKPQTVRAKASSDYVTEVDKMCEEVLLAAIRQNFPTHRVLSEEGAGMEWGAGITWIVDPLDGTTNFIHGFPMVAVSVGVAIDLRPFLGLVLDPLRDELFVARRGKGAYLNGMPIRVRTHATVQDSLMATGFPHRAKGFLKPYIQALERILTEANDLRRAGSAALDLAYVACGRLDGFWEPGLKCWDVAAGGLLVEEAGGIVTDFWGEPQYLFNGHVIAGAPLIHRFLMEQIGYELAPALEAMGFRRTGKG